MGSLDAAPPALLKDINTTADVSGINPSALCVAGSTVYFVGNDAMHGQELWKSDGTVAGTRRIKDIAPGEQSAGVSSFLVVNDVVYFTANDGAHGLELWKTDGTEAGTVMVKDIQPGAGSGGPGAKFAADGFFFFAASDGASGAELWRSDGTEEGTVLVKDILPGGSSLTTFAARVMDNVLYFTANDGVHGPELWRSDGTDAGTMLVKDVRPGDNMPPLPIGPSEFVVVGSTLYFSHSDVVHGTELWKTDGTEAGTVMVKDSFPGSVSGGAGNKENVGGVLFFTATDATRGTELWKSDGSEAGTVLVKDLVVGTGSPNIVKRVVVGGTYYFSATASGLGTELWKTDGTDAGTVIVSDLTASSGSSSFSNFGVVGGTVYFSFGNLTTGRELWKTDGTSVGTVQVKEIWIGSGNSNPAEMVDLGGMLVFAATSGNANSITPLSVDLWKSNGTDAGTTMLKPMAAGTASSGAVARLVVGNTLLLAANDGVNGLELWKTDGTAEGTLLVKDILPGSGNSSPTFLVQAGGTTFFRADNGVNGVELWKTDGTDAGTVLVKDIVAGIGASSPRDLVALNGVLYFAASSASPSVNTELWRSDGTADGTVQVKDLLPGTLSSSPLGLTVFNGRIFFSANDGANGIELWSSDGTDAGTVMVKNVAAAGNSSPGQLKVVGPHLYFVANDGVNGIELWKTDGTEAGTVMVKNVHPSGSSNPARLTVAGEVLYFTATDGANGTELWRTDGTDAGTVMVKDLVPGAGSPSGLTSLVMHDGMLYFPAGDSATGIELWKSDGTDAGTVMVKEIRPGSGSSEPANLISAGDSLYFSANDGMGGHELWTTDGSEIGTFMVTDLTGESGSSSPADLALFRGKLYFSATTTAVGREMWRYAIPIPEIEVKLAAADLVDGDAAPVDFGTRVIHRNVDRTFALHNAGEALLKNVAISIDGPDAGMFHVISSVGPVLAPLSGVPLMIRFTPTSEGVKEATLHISSNDPDEAPFDIVLRGAGRLPIPGVISFNLPAATTLLVDEEEGVVRLPIIRTVGSDDDVGFTFSATPISALPGTDFVMPASQHVLPDGITTLDLPIAILDPPDTNERNEAFIVNLSAPTGGASLGLVTSVAVVIVDSRDRTAPTRPTVTYPVKYQTLNLDLGEAITVTGEAQDNKGIARVEVSLNGGEFVAAALINQGFSPAGFSIAVTPSEGSNTLVVRSTDTSGHMSPLKTRTFQVNSPLTVTVDPEQGCLWPSSFAGTTYRVSGKTYTISVKARTEPEPGYIFKQWVIGGGNGQGVYTPENIGLSQEALRRSELTFVHLGGLELTAEFVPNQFGLVTGTYHGLIRGVAGPAMNGSITLAVQKTGAFSGKIIMDGQDYQMSGVLDTTGYATFGSAREEVLVLNRRGKPPIRVNFWLDLQEGARLAGVATQEDSMGALTSSSIEADRAVFDGKSHVVPAEYLGPNHSTASYTMVLALSAAQPYLSLEAEDAPQGFSHAMVTLSKSGVVQLTGKLSDDTPVTLSSTLTRRLDGSLTCPVFTQLYDKDGFLISMLSFDVSQHESDVTGTETVWSRPLDARSDYPDGWTEGLFMDCVAARYLVTSGRCALPMFDGYVQPDDEDSRGDALPPTDADGNAALTFSAASLAPHVKHVNVSSNDSVSKVPSSDKSYSLSISRESGRISGEFTHPVWGTKPSFEGVIYQKGSAAGAYGYYLTKNHAKGDADRGFGGVSLLGKP